jgi:hypothetical protein
MTGRMSCGAPRMRGGTAIWRASVSRTADPGGVGAAQCWRGCVSHQSGAISCHLSVAGELCVGFANSTFRVAHSYPGSAGGVQVRSGMKATQQSCDNAAAGGSDHYVGARAKRGNRASPVAPKGSRAALAHATRNQRKRIVETRLTQRAASRPNYRPRFSAPPRPTKAERRRSLGSKRLSRQAISVTLTSRYREQPYQPPRARSARGTGCS